VLRTAPTARNRTPAAGKDKKNRFYKKHACGGQGCRATGGLVLPLNEIYSHNSIHKERELNSAKKSHPASARLAPSIHTQAPDTGLNSE
jgi:hypothetical protein